ncbi:hypothetical protein ABIB40_003722 [Pedobacter sp. UYP30]
MKFITEVPYFFEFGKQRNKFGETIKHHGFAAWMVRAECNEG